MIIRPIKAAEALKLPKGSDAWRVKDGIHLIRGHRIAMSDDRYSVSFTNPATGEYNYYEDGEVGLKEPEPVKEQLHRPAEELGVYRPDLNTRKVGKVRVELVDDGFPLALREVAKVMTWAQTAKGYKDHDWQNLPNAEQALSAAASRHRSDYIMQRMIGDLPASECVDPESALIHKAHEAFGVLAQLELALRGKFEGRAAQL